jgi:hypothetical protein
MHEREFEAEARGVQLAAELLDVTNEAELERFLGRVVAATVRGIGGRLPVSTGRSLVATLRGTAERTLPTLDRLLGDPMRPTGGGPSSAATAARVYGLELEGMSAEDRDYEIARQFVRFAQSAAARAATAPASAAEAVAGAAREYAPGLRATDHGAATRGVSPIRN